MGVSFKLNNADFSLLTFSTFPKSCSSVSVSLPFATSCNSFSDNVSLSPKHFSNSTNELLPRVDIKTILHLWLFYSFSYCNFYTCYESII